MRKKRQRKERQRGSRGWRGRERVCVCAWAENQRMCVALSKTDKEKQKET